MRKKANVKITLKSDLCVSSGYAFAGVIDTDVCMDSYGFPYIPARRLKGIMREAAEMIGVKDIESIFGKGGSGFNEYGSSLRLSDAVIQEMEAVKEEIERTKVNGKSILSAQGILELFSVIKAQTAINENGVADEQTLRYLRVVNQYMPKVIDAEQKEIVFEAELEYDADCEAILKSVIRAVRHIGMDRNRGLGNVRCELDTEHAVMLSVTEELRKYTNSAKSETENSAGLRKLICYTVRNKGALMLSSTKDDISEKYISGRVVLGALAGIYLNMFGLEEPDDVFYDLFLNGETIFSNLYVTDSPNKNYVPVPMFLNRLKKMEKYVCVLKSDNDISDEYLKKEYSPEDGNQPKKLTGKYLYWVNNKINVIEPKMDIVWHNSKSEIFDKERMGKGSDGQILYSSEAIEAGQLFSGTILVPEKYQKLVEELLNSKQLRFGKSKTAQYGSCELVSCEAKLYEQVKHQWKSGDRVMVVLESDAVISGDYGYTVECDAVMEHIANKIGLKRVENPRVFMTTNIATGYNAKMNLKRASVPAVAAGSAFEFEVAGSEMEEKFIGSFCAEGFGKIRLFLLDDFTYVQETINEKAGDMIPKPNEQNNELVISIKKALLKNEWFEAVKAAYVFNREMFRTRISAALVGRVTLMLRESCNKEQETDRRLEDFAKRVNSIKRIEEREEIIRKLKEWKICEITAGSQVKNLFKVENFKDRIREFMCEPIICAEKDLLQEIDVTDLWDEGLRFCLLHTKYMKSGEKRR